MARKRYGFYVLAIILLLVAAVCLYLGSYHSLIRPLGIGAIFAGLYFARISKVHDRSVLPDGSIDLRSGEGPGRLLWIVSLSLVPLLGGAFFLLFIDRANGGHAVWPVYLFAGVGLTSAFVWATLVSKIVGRNP